MLIYGFFEKADTFIYEVLFGKNSVEQCKLEENIVINALNLRVKQLETDLIQSLPKFVLIYSCTTRKSMFA